MKPFPTPKLMKMSYYLLSFAFISILKNTFKQVPKSSSFFTQEKNLSQAQQSTYLINLTFQKN